MKKNYNLKLFGFCVLLFMGFVGYAQTVFINEIHYDNVGGDVAEAIELVVPETTDLNGWTLELYNGRGGAVYRTVDLSTTTLQNAIGGLGFILIELPTNGLQNGAPDGIALIDNTNTVIQFLSYEGVFEATDGAAIGLTSTDIEVAETSSTAIGTSLQLTGDGLVYTDFTWSPSDTSTYGAINSGQSFGGISPPPPPVPTDEIIPIATARDAESGTTVTITGTLTVTDQFGGSAYLQDTTGAIAVFDRQIHGEGVFAIGDSITITGTRSAFNDQVQLSRITNVVSLGKAKQPITPLKITASEAAQYPGYLVVVDDVDFSDQNNLLFANSNYTLEGSTSSLELRIDGDVESLVGKGVQQACAQITGVVGRFRNTFQLLPRFDIRIYLVPHPLNRRLIRLRYQLLTRLMLQPGTLNGLEMRQILQ